MVTFNFLCVVLQITYLANINSSDWVGHSAILKAILKNRKIVSSWDYIERFKNTVYNE